MSKRITYLQRRADLSAAHFSQHWRHAHAEIAVDLPGAVGYRQSHGLPRAVADSDPQQFRIDGIVELWFTSADVAQAGIRSTVTERLIEDEPRFLAGLSGAAVAAPEPAPLSACAVWVLCWAQEAGAVSTEALRTIEDALGGQPGAGAVTVNTLEPGADLLLRECLQQMPALPGCAVSAGFASRDQARRAEIALRQDLIPWDADLAGLETLTADLVSIIEPPRPHAHAASGRSGRSNGGPR